MALASSKTGMVLMESGKWSPPHEAMLPPLRELCDSSGAALIDGKTCVLLGGRGEFVAPEVLSSQRSRSVLSDRMGVVTFGVSELVACLAHPNALQVGV